MRAYQFLQRCHPRCDLRAADVSTFLKLAAEVFDVEFWTYRGEKIETDVSSIERRLRSLIDPKVPGAGASWVLASHHNENPIIVLISTGSDEWGRDFFDIDFSRRNVLPDLSYFRQSIQLCMPFEACIIDNKNEIDLDSLERQRRFPNFQRPAIVRWFHYFGAAIVETLGGREYCLLTPAFKTEVFCGGVLLQLTDEPFDADNPRHKEIQIQAMRYLGLW